MHAVLGLTPHLALVAVHHVVGDLELSYESMDMVSDPGLTLTIYAAEPASATAHALDLLASWTSAVVAGDADAHADGMS